MARGRAAGARATIACAWPASACTTAAIPKSRALLHAGQPYTGWAGFVESANAHGGVRAAQATLAARLGLRVNTLVTRCLPEVLDVWEAVAAQHPIRDLRWVLVHLNGADAAQLARIKRLGAVATTNPISYLLALGRRRGGAARRRRRHAAAAPESAAPPHPFGLATDNKPADPWVAFVAVVARRDMTSGGMLGPAERLSRARRPARAHRGRRVDHAHRARARACWRRGVAPISPCSRAIRSRCRSRSCRAMPVRLTMVGGAVVHGSECLESRA